MTRRFAFLFFTIFIAFLSIIYSMLSEYPNVKKMMEATMALSITAQIGSRFALYLMFPEEIVEAHKDMVEFYAEHEKSNQQRQLLLSSHFKLLRNVKNFLLVIHAFCQFGPIAWSLATFFVTGKYLYPLPIYLPFLDRYSPHGFIVNCCFQIYLNVVLYLANPAVDTLYFMFITHLKIEVDLFQCTVEEFADALSSYSFKTASAKKKTDRMLEKLIDDHLKIINFHEKMESPMNKQFSALITMNVYVICASGVSLITSEFTFTIGIAILYPIQIFIVCVLGTYICHQQERLEMILWQFDWHKLQTLEQKKFGFMMLNVQQGLSLEPIFLGTVNMELFTTVWGIYNRRKFLLKAFIISDFEHQLLLLHDHVELDCRLGL